MSNDPEPSTALATLEAYAGKANVLSPVISLEGDAVSPFLVESIQVVKIVPEVDTYHDFRYANEREGKHALSGLGLAKIAAAAGIKWVPELTGVEARERRPDGHVYIRFRAAGAIRQPNGEWHLELATKEIDTADEEEELREAYRRRSTSPRGKPMTEQEIEDAVRRDVLALRKNVLGHAETKAKNRVIRRILALRQVYTVAELSRPFAVPRLLYRPQYAEEAARVELEGRTASEELFGPAPALSSGAPIVEEETSEATPEPAAAAASSADEAASPPPRTRKAKPKEEPAVDEQAALEAVKEGLGATEVEGEPSEEETWRPPAQTEIVEPDRPKVDPALPGGKRFSELAKDDPAELVRIAETSKADARRKLAREWLAWGEGGRRE